MEVIDYKKLDEIKLYVLGINGIDGKLLTKPVMLKKFYPNISRIAVRKSDKVLKDYFKESYKTFYDSVYYWPDKHFIAKEEAGWGLVINKSDKDLLEYLKPLIERRKGKVYYYNNEAPYEFIEKYLSWDADYTKMPYYILIVGSIKSVPLELQYLLDVRHSVGRIYFDDLNDYKLYIKKLIEFKPNKDFSVMFFSPIHSEDDPTYYSSKYLVKPLVEILTGGEDLEEVRVLEGEKATEENLFKSLEGQRANILFTASHGLGLPKKHPDKKILQGAIVCQDVELNRNLLKSNKGLITGLDIKERSLNCDLLFMFGCYTAGTLKDSDFKFWVPEDVKNSLEEFEASKEDFIAYLPQKLLADPKGPVAVVAHIDPAWVFSFMNEYQNSQRLEPFKNSLPRLIGGVPVGRSVRDFNLRYATLSVALLNYVLDHIEKSEKLNPLSLSNIWVTRQDAQNYIILGDPLVSVSPIQK